MNVMIKFVLDYLGYIIRGDKKYYLWLGFLALFIIPWLYGNFMQLKYGMIVTGLTDQVSWGLYLANFVFLVGVAAGAVTVVFPAYVYKFEPLHKVSVLGEMLAVASVVMCLLFVLMHMGRPDRLWHMIPVIGIYNFPHSMLTWDVLVLTVYLFLNLIGGFYFLYKKYAGEPLNNKFYLPVIFIAIGWAISIHTVTAFLINTMPARPMWHHGMMPIRFISTAFAAGPALIIIVFLTIRKNTALWIEDKAIDLLSTIVVACLTIALFLTMSEVVTELYHPTEHSAGLQYLILGKHGLENLVPFFWGSLVAMVLGWVLLMIPSIRKNYNVLSFICAMLFLGIWIEKGMGLLIPGSIPTPIGEFTQYSPTLLEIGNCLGNWAIGFIIMTLLLKGAIGILLGDVKYSK
ncbi:MAG TPA: NrfD/PsrC family molybdoenzyme membrane anchor subunit [Pseudomonadales bacterium]|jgi:molybdopterin-containing oxidoreductase family membrane subunit|nr:polysulfide reductase [Gammaproteobacteria bacterium]MDP6027870.1 polysulfide reductase NrfD [Pseudomonadales bacterium]MDP6316171.1 polysulfide reductase NrfD [Pseudomonadales bacterium]MDP7315641.1 polysulfide reductase NrfD [Pseudomonadales bacterium]HJP50764.1 NrfD/PsrC family molybdoenzyme membrane anchor subunit [Pseudomonadales bacterium]|tara:strand:- start:191 stop:1399 length:1209 start_codon:yes stop_codon:yes gene_type:complete